MIQEIKWAWQRVVRGYDDRVFWGFDSYFEQIIPALEKFCISELQAEFIDENPIRKEVFTKTLELITEYHTAEQYDSYPFTVTSWAGQHEKLANLAEYFGRNINHYWD